MGIISEVKCGRCDRRYSGLRARCPYCGARRGKRGKHARDKDNSTGRVVIGLILVVVLIVAVVAVIATSVTGQQPDGGQQETNQGGNIADSDGVTNVEGVGAGEDEGDDEDADVGTEEGSTDAGQATGTEDEGDTEGEGAGVSTAVNTLYITTPGLTIPRQTLLQVLATLSSSATLQSLTLRMQKSFGKPVTIMYL